MIWRRILLHLNMLKHLTHLSEHTRLPFHWSHLGKQNLQITLLWLECNNMLQCIKVLYNRKINIILKLLIFMPHFILGNKKSLDGLWVVVSLKDIIHLQVKLSAWLLRIHLKRLRAAMVCGDVLRLSQSLRQLVDSIYYSYQVCMWNLLILSCDEKIQKSRNACHRHFEHFLNHISSILCQFQQTQNVEPMLFRCWTTS